MGHGSVHTFVVSLLTISLTASVANAAEVEQASFVGPPAPEELEVLAPLVGQWEIHVDVKPSLALKNGYSSNGEATARWIHNGHYLHLDGFANSASGRFEWSEIIAYDRNARQFRRFVFSTEGFAAQSVGRWNDKTQTMRWKVVSLPDRWSGEATTHFGKDSVDFTLLITNDQGKTTRSSSMTMVDKSKVP